MAVAADDAHLLDEQSALVGGVHLLRGCVVRLELAVQSRELSPDALTAVWRDELLPRVEV